MPTAPEGGWKLYGGRSHLANNPEKGRASKRKIKTCSLSKWRDDRWLKNYECMAPDEPKEGLLNKITGKLLIYKTFKNLYI